VNHFDVPDCTGWSALLHRHAQQLVAAGVDYVAADMTNLVGCRNNVAVLLLCMPGSRLLRSAVPAVQSGYDSVTDGEAPGP